MPYIGVPKGSSGKQMMSSEGKSREMKENGLRNHSYGRESLSVERTLATQRVGFSDNTIPAGCQRLCGQGTALYLQLFIST